MIEKGIIGRLKPYMYLMPAVLIMLVILAYPIGYNFVISFFQWTLRTPERPFIGFENFERMITDEHFLTILGNTFIWTVLGVFLQMVLGVGLAIFTDSVLGGWKRKYMRTIALIPWLIPGVVTALIWRWMMQSDVGIINSTLMATGLTSENILFLSSPNVAMYSLIFVNTWKATPFWFLMITAGLQSKPVDQIEAATIDGARFPSILRYVILPHLSPVITATGVLTTIWTLNYFDVIWVMTRGGPMNATSTLPIYTYRLAFEFNNFGRSAAMAVITLVITSIICIPYARKMFLNMREDGVL